MLIFEPPTYFRAFIPVPDSVLVLVGSGERTTEKCHVPFYCNGVAAARMRVEEALRVVQRSIQRDSAPEPLCTSVYGLPFRVPRRCGDCVTPYSSAMPPRASREDASCLTE